MLTAAAMEDDVKKHRTLQLFGRIRQLCRPPGKPVECRRVLQVKFLRPRKKS